MGIGIADFNGDGALDVLIVNDTERDLLYVNQKNGSFKEEGLRYGIAYNDVAARVSGMGCDVKDFNNDGWVDAFYSNLQGQTWALFRSDAGERFDYVSLGIKHRKVSRFRLE